MNLTQPVMPPQFELSGSFIWSVNEKLGGGATAVVYKGRNKVRKIKSRGTWFNYKMASSFQVTREWVAIKKFNRSSRIRPDEYRILQQLQHPNIVKLLAIESEVSYSS